MKNNCRKLFYLFTIILILSFSLFIFSGCGGVASLLTTAASTSLGGMQAWVFVPGAGARNVSHTSKVSPPSGFIALPGATLTIVGTSKSAVTDSSGYASITGLASGTYTVTVAKEGYKTYSYTVTVSTGEDTDVGGSGGIQTETSTTPGIMDLSATSGVTTTSITITGVNFGSTQDASTITFGGLSAAVTSWSSTQIVCTVPVGAVTGNVVVTVNSEASNAVPFTVTGEGLPSAPSNLTATAVSSTQINLSWTSNSTTETGFKIERKTGAGGTYAQIATVGAGVTAYNNTSLTSGTNYYYRVRAYNTAGNSGYSNEANATTAAPTYALRDVGPAGGWIFYVDPPDAKLLPAGITYLEAAPNDQSTSLKWGTADSVLIGTLTGIGKGQANTNAIVLHYTAGTDYAAGLCQVPIGGYSDWFLPSQDELDKMYINLKKGTDEHDVTYTPVGGFADYYYWSSSEYNNAYAWSQDFTTGTPDHWCAKGDPGYVRAIRAF